MSSSPHAAPWLVLKFGGTSVSSRPRWDEIGRVAMDRSKGARALVVVSALSGITNDLQAIATGAEDDPASAVASIIERHRALAGELGLDADAVLGERFAALHALVADQRRESRAYDWQAEVLAQGELMSSTLGAAYLAAQGLDAGWCDAREWLDALAMPNRSDWADRLSVNCERNGNADWQARFAGQPAAIIVTQGFIARHGDGGTAILGRGGSDTSAAYFGALLGAERVEIWTDVPGMFSANPREVPDARLLARLDYAEAQEIAGTGAKVLHPRAISPCRDARVPMAILDTSRPDHPGTRIDASVATVPGVKAISRRNGIVLVSMESVGMWQQVGFLADVFERFRRHGLSVDMIGSSETNVTVSLDPNENLVNTDVLSRLSEDLAEVCRVKVIAPCAAITLVGRGMRSMLHKLSDIWAMFGQERVHLVSQSSNDLNLSFVIDEADADGMLAELHAALIDSGAMPIDEPGVFGPSWRQIDGSARRRGPRWWEAANERERLLALADEGTPHYVYHLPTLRARARQLAAVDAVDRRFFAIKANSHPTILRTLVDEGFGLECVSRGEVERVSKIAPDLPMERILFTPSFAPRAEYAFALERGINVTLDNVEALKNWPEVFSGRSLWLRVDLGRGDGHHDKVKTGGKSSKFGLPLERFDEFIAEARKLDTRITGLHAHLGSGVSSAQHWNQIADELGGLADRIGSIDTIDIGGGLPIPYEADDEPFDVDAWAAGLAQIKAAHPAYRLAIEPGRFLVAECGAMVSRVTQVVDKLGIRRVGSDAGMHTLMRPALYDAWHDIVNLSRLDDADVVDADIVGPICESTDVFGKRRPMPRATAEGDILLFSDAGAYGYSMANEYNLRGMPAETVIDATVDET